MIYIILPVYNRKNITLDFVKSLKKQTYKDFILLLVDDGSIDGTSEEVKKELENTIILKGNGNLWWGGALQKAYKYIKKSNFDKNSFVLIINDDTHIEEDFLENGIKILKNNDKSIIQAKGYDLKEKDKCIDNGAFIDWTNFTFHSNFNKINCFTTRGLLIRLNNFIEIGGFYPILLPHYASDIEYTHRFYKKGYNLIIDDSFKIWINRETTGISMINLYKYPFISFLKKTFSKRCMDNPITLFNLVLISSPIKYKFQNLLRVIKRSFIAIIQYFYSNKI